MQIWQFCNRKCSSYYPQISLEATIGFQGQNIVIRLCYLHVSLKYRRKLLKNREYGNPVGKYWQHCNRKCSSDYLQTSPRGTPFCVCQKIRRIKKNAKVEFSPKIVFTGSNINQIRYVWFIFVIFSFWGSLCCWEVEGLLSG